MKITFAGKELELKSLTLNELVELEDRGIDLGKFKSGKITPSFKELRDILYVVLHKADSSMTLEIVGENIDPFGNSELISEIVNFIAAGKSQNLKK